MSDTPETGTPGPPPLDVARGDQALSDHLRRALRTLRDRNDNEDFRRVVDDVLAGRKGLREVYLSPAFAAGLDPGVRQFAQRYEQLSPEERAELAERGAAGWHT
jgi:hypothetical protein